MTHPAPDRLFVDFQSAIAGRYSLERELGRGGMGIVYLARDLRLERVVAIKLLPPDRATDGAARERFLREARTAAKLSHPNIVPIHAVEEIGAFVLFVMAYVEGETLGARVRRDGTLRAHDAARILREVAWALAYAHGQGVVHRDVKPENILLERAAGRALVADFGIAGSVQAVGSGEHGLIGTPEFMSPEQAGGEPLDGRSDVYSLGVVAYYALSGRLPFTSATVAGLLAQQISKRPPPLVVPGAPAALVSAVERCLEKAPAARFQSGEELAEALGAVLEIRRDLPVPIRAFLAASRTGVRAKLVGTWVASALLIPTGLAMLVRGVFPARIPAFFTIGINVVALTLCAGAVLTPVVWELRRIRQLLRSGYRRADVLQGLQLEMDRRREEQEYADGAVGPNRWERLMSGKAYGSLALAALAGAAAFVVPYPAVLIAFGVFGLASATAVATAIAAHAAARGRLGAEEESRLKFWKGRLGRLFFRLAGIGLGRGGTATPPPVIDRPTEVALGLAALDLFEALPAGMQRQLKELPALVRGLEERVRRLRGKDRDGHFGEALGALETLRLDLLRLHAGQGTLDGLTADLGAARRLGEQVDVLLAGRREVDEALSKTP
ncbi:MAG TPA: serine/threonine-protein kinase [Gemmatimonadales bacterium]|nr:serine/threonine-protein kinase [Gemmatimonadales bacterium]